MTCRLFIPAAKLLLCCLFAVSPFLLGCASTSSGGSSGTSTPTGPSGPAITTGSGTLSVTPGTITIHPGDQNVPVTVGISGSSYIAPINVTLTGLPSGITVSPLTLSNGGSGTLNISASVSADQEGFNATSPTFSDANTSTTSVSVTAVEGTGLVTAPLSLVVSLSNPAFAPAPSEINLPIATINTSGQPIVSKTVDIPGTITITSANGQTSYLPNSKDSDNTALFHVHGNSTAEMPKLAYEFKLNTSLDLLNTMGLQCPYITPTSSKPTCDKSKTYILLANYDDKTLLRDWSASALANAIPIGGAYLNSPADSPSPSGTAALMPWAAHSLYVELYLNGVYEGNYQLIEKVTVDAHRVNINELAATDVSDDITGGYLLEVDNYEDEAYVFMTPHNLPIGLVDPDFSPDPEVPQQTAYITGYVDAAETALFATNFANPTLGWRAYYDPASAVNWYIVNDVMGNVDAGVFYSSVYFYKNIDNPFLYMGPVWDFDYSSGNVGTTPIENPTTSWVATQNAWYLQWFKDASFKADVASQWNALKNSGVFTAWIASINQQAATLQQSQANNFGRWPMQGIEVWPNAQAAGTYNGELAYYTNWLNLRIGYLDSVFNNKAATFTALSVPAGQLRGGTAATLSAQVTGENVPTGNVSFLSGSVLLGTVAVNGSGSASLTTTNLPAGNDRLEAIYGGDSNNALSVSSVDTATVLAPLVSSVTSLSISASNTMFTVVVLGNSGTQVPTGTITFLANQQAIGTSTLSSAGTCAFSPATPPIEGASIQAEYSGDNTFGGSSSAAQTVP